MHKFISASEWVMKNPLPRPLETKRRSSVRQVPPRCAGPSPSEHNSKRHEPGNNRYRNTTRSRSRGDSKKKVSKFAYASKSRSHSPEKRQSLEGWLLNPPRPDESEGFITPAAAVSQSEREAAPISLSGKQQPAPAEAEESLSEAEAEAKAATEKNKKEREALTSEQSPVPPEPATILPTAKNEASNTKDVAWVWSPLDFWISGFAVFVSRYFWILQQ